MATTSPDNLRTPDPGDPYNLVPDLQTLAQDVQDALNDRGNAFRGTVAERTAFLSTAVPGMLWQDTDGIGMLWKRGSSQWVPAVWRWSGTTAQMNAFTQAPNGFEWFNTTTNSEYVRLGGAWASGVLSHIQLDTSNTMQGVVTQHGIGRVTESAVTQVSKAVTFPVPFASTPVLHVSYIGGRLAGAFNPKSAVDEAPGYMAKGVQVTESGFMAFVNRGGTVALSEGWQAYFSWSATGALA